MTRLRPCKAMLRRAQLAYLECSRHCTVGFGRQQRGQTLLHPKSLAKALRLMTWATVMHSSAKYKHSNMAVARGVPRSGCLQ